MAVAPELLLRPEYDRVAHKLSCAVVVPARCRQRELEREMLRVMDVFIRDMALQGYVFLRWLRPSKVRAYYEPLGQLPKLPVQRPFRVDDVEGWRADEAADRAAAAALQTPKPLDEVDGWQFEIHGLFAARPLLTVLDN